MNSSEIIEHFDDTNEGCVPYTDRDCVPYTKGQSVPYTENECVPYTENECVPYTPTTDRVKYVKDYHEEHYDKITVYFPKGRINTLRKMAKDYKMSLGKFLWEAAVDYVSRKH